MFPWGSRELKPLFFRYIDIHVVINSPSWTLADVTGKAFNTYILKCIWDMNAPFIIVGV